MELSTQSAQGKVSAEGRVQRMSGGSAAILLEPASPQIMLRIQLIGPMQAISYLGENMLPRSRKARAILASLCLARGEWVPRSRLASILWGTVSESQARASMRQALRELVSRLGNLAAEVIEVDHSQVRLNTKICWVDALTLLDGGANTPGVRAAELLRLCDGRLLEDLDGASVALDHWLMAERSRFADSLGALHEAEMVRLNSSGVAPEERISAARRIIAFDPINEGACRMLMLALAQNGDRVQALREYSRLESNVRVKLDTEPSRETKALYDAIRVTRPNSNSTVVAASEPLNEPDAAAIALAPTQPAKLSRLRLGVMPFHCFDDRVSGHLPLAIAQEAAGALARFRSMLSLRRRSIAYKSEKPIGCTRFEN